MFAFDYVFTGTLTLSLVLLSLALIRKNGSRSSRPRLIVWIVVAVSFLWLACAVKAHSMLGPDYSTLRWYIIGSNLFLMIGSALASLIVRSVRSADTSVAALCTAFAWLLAGAMSSVV